MRKLSTFNIVSIAFGIGFLYLPIASLTIYAFSASSSVGAWGGWSTQWYAALSNDAPMRDAAFVSLRLALAAATLATILGSLAAIALERLPRFRGRLPFTSLIYAPLVTPVIVTGLAMLLLFVATSIDRGFWTAAIAHTTMAMGLVAVIVQTRLISFTADLEEAAMDLGATPADTFRDLTLPLILPAVAAGWLLAFALSLGDLLLASFTTSPATTTLPIRIYANLRLSPTPELNAVCSIVIAVVGVIAIAASVLAGLGRAPISPGSRPAAGTDRTGTTPAR